MNKRISNVVIGVLAIVSSILLCACSSNGNYEKVIESYIDAQFTGDAEKSWKLLPPEIRECALEEAKEEMYLINEEEVIEYLQSQMQNAIDTIDGQLGEGWTYSYEISEVEDKDAEDLMELNQSYREMGASEFKATAAKDVTVIVNMESSGGEYAEERIFYVDMVQIDGKWYVTDY